MKKYFYIFLILFPGSIYAQHPTQGVKLIQYAFDEFTPGNVKMKSGETSSQILNYNIVTNEMIFDNNGTYLAIAQPENVDTVYISDRKFIPLNNKFYEVLVNGKMPLLLEFTATILEPGTPTGYGGTSRTTAAQAFKSLINTGGAYSLKAPDGFKVIQGYNFLIMKNNQLQKAGSETQLEKIFSDKKEIIKDFVKKNKTNFSKREDMIALIKQVE
ncbi:MAG: hypothetical protein ABI267_00050 [Ginsengibacter sp.]